MKRIRKMVPLAAVAERMASSRQNQTEKRLGFDLRVCQVLGPHIAKRVEKISMQRNTLVLYVSDSIWRKQLEIEKSELLQYLKAAVPEIHVLQIRSSP